MTASKRIFDIIAAIVLMILFAPIIAAVALAILAMDGRPVFYFSERMSTPTRGFKLVKFRTMRTVAVDSGVSGGDKAGRVTRTGAVLRRTRLDELPQLWNVLRGEMSLIGPRPYLPRESKEIGATQSGILRVPPGMSGPWQVAGRNQSSFEDRVCMDDYYVHDWSVWLDIVLLARTVKTVLLSRGAY